MLLRNEYNADGIIIHRHATAEKWTGNEDTSKALCGVDNVSSVLFEGSKHLVSCPACRELICLPKITECVLSEYDKIERETEKIKARMRRLGLA